MTNFLLALAMCYVLIKIPFWVLGSVRGSKRSFLSSAIRGILMYKTAGLVRGLAGAASSTSASPSASSAGETDPYARTKTTCDGQYVLPLTGMARGKRPASPHERYAPPRQSRPRRGGSGVQKSLFDRDGQPTSAGRPPESMPQAWRHTPAVGEQHMLPIIPAHHPTSSDDPEPEPRPSGGKAVQQPTLVTATGRVRAEARPRRLPPAARPTPVAPGEQYPLPLIGRLPRTQPDRNAHTSSAPESRGEPPQVVGQQALLDTHGRVRPAARARQPRRRSAVPVPAAYCGIRPDQHGQYRLPLGVSPAPAPRPRSRPVPESTDVEPEVPVDDEQLVLDLPTPPRPRRRPTGGGQA